jgi:hypothetical protein
LPDDASLVVVVSLIPVPFFDFVTRQSILCTKSGTSSGGAVIRRCAVQDRLQSLHHIISALLLQTSSQRDTSDTATPSYCTIFSSTSFCLLTRVWASPPLGDVFISHRSSSKVRLNEHQIPRFLIPSADYLLLLCNSCPASGKMIVSFASKIIHAFDKKNLQTLLVLAPMFKLIRVIKTDETFMSRLRVSRGVNFF